MVELLADGKILKICADQGQMNVQPESILINLEERQIISIKKEYPRSQKYIKVLNNIRYMYGFTPASMVLVISHIPRDSKTMRTMTDDIIYVNISEYMTDMRRLENMIITNFRQETLG